MNFGPSFLDFDENSYERKAAYPENDIEIQQFSDSDDLSQKTENINDLNNFSDDDYDFILENFMQNPDGCLNYRNSYPQDDIDILLNNNILQPDNSHFSPESPNSPSSSIITNEPNYICINKSKHAVPINNKQSNHEEKHNSSLNISEQVTNENNSQKKEKRKIGCLKFSPEQKNEIEFQKKLQNEKATVFVQNELGLLQEQKQDESDKNLNEIKLPKSNLIQSSSKKIDTKYEVAEINHAFLKNSNDLKAGNLNCDSEPKDFHIESPSISKYIHTLDQTQLNKVEEFQENKHKHAKIQLSHKHSHHYSGDSEDFHESTKQPQKYINKNNNNQGTSLQKYLPVHQQQHQIPESVSMPTRTSVQNINLVDIAPTSYPKDHRVQKNQISHKIISPANMNNSSHQQNRLFHESHFKQIPQPHSQKQDASHFIYEEKVIDKQSSNYSKSQMQFDPNYYPLTQFNQPLSSRNYNSNDIPPHTNPLRPPNSIPPTMHIHNNSSRYELMPSQMDKDCFSPPPSKPFPTQRYLPNNPNLYQSSNQPQSQQTQLVYQDISNIKRNTTDKQLQYYSKPPLKQQPRFYQQSPVRQCPQKSFNQQQSQQNYIKPRQHPTPAPSIQMMEQKIEDSLQKQIDTQNLLQKNIEGQVLSKAVFEPPFFFDALSREELILNPYQLRFEPQSFWNDVNENITFGMLVNKFFRTKNLRISRFIYKLYDMLLITLKIPFFKGIVGVNWITYRIFSVNVQCIAAMLNLTASSIDSYLFGVNGNFTTLGFVEITPNNFQEAGLSSFPEISEPNIKLMFHRGQKFVNKELSTQELDEIDIQYTMKRYSQINNNKISRPKYPIYS